MVANLRLVLRGLVATQLPFPNSTSISSLFSKLTRIKGLCSGHTSIFAHGLFYSPDNFAIEISYFSQKFNETSPTVPITDLYNPACSRYRAPTRLATTEPLFRSTKLTSNRTASVAIPFWTFSFCRSRFFLSISFSFSRRNVPFFHF